MEIHFKVAHSDDKDISSKAIDLAERKIRNLKKYLGKTNKELGIQVYVDLGKSTEAHQTGPIWRAQINLDAPGQRFHAYAVAERVEVAIATAVAEIEQELRKSKELKKNMIRRSGTAIKSILRGFSS